LNILSVITQLGKLYLAPQTSPYIYLLTTDSKPFLNNKPFAVLSNKVKNHMPWISSNSTNVSSGKFGNKLMKIRLFHLHGFVE